MGMNLALRFAIVESGKRQIVIAAKAGIAEPTLSKIVNGHLEPTDLQKRAIAKVLRRPISSLFPASQEVA